MSIFSIIVMSAVPAKSQQDSLEAWLESEANVAQARMNDNISPSGAVPGVIVASPSHRDPDYYFHWIRDSALVMNTLLTSTSASTENSSKESWLLGTFTDYANFSRQLQQTTTLTGLGEPRFNVDGTAFNGAWARPQNDGPALRVLTILHGLARFRTSPTSLPTSLQVLLQNILQADLHYILSHFQEPCFDLWEEVKGDHFYTRLIQLAALSESLERFDSSWDISRQELQTAIDNLQKALEQHWRVDKKYFSATLNRREGAETYKFTDLDSAVILAVLHSNREAGNFSVRDDRILATAEQLESVFSGIYKLNSPSLPTNYPVAPAIGRYADDVYFGGNPWYITTAAFAELNYRLALRLAKNKSFYITEFNLRFLQKTLALTGSNAGTTTGPKAALARLKRGLNFAQHPQLLKELQNALKARGDLFMARLRLHTPLDGGMAEQFGRDQGEPLSARDLTWSYASFLSAWGARKEMN